MKGSQRFKIEQRLNKSRIISLNPRKKILKTYVRYVRLGSEENKRGRKKKKDKSKMEPKFNFLLRNFFILHLNSIILGFYFTFKLNNFRSKSI